MVVMAAGSQAAGCLVMAAIKRRQQGFCTATGDRKVATAARELVLKLQCLVRSAAAVRLAYI
jgi:hypothetical protein